MPPSLPSARDVAARLGGRCHCACLVGERILLFGGGADVSDALGWCDISRESEAHVGATAIRAPDSEPSIATRRLSAVAVRAGGALLVHGGWRGRSLGDTLQLRLDDDNEDADATHASERVTATVADGGLSPLRLTPYLVRQACALPTAAMATVRRCLRRVLQRLSA